MTTLRINTPFGTTLFPTDLLFKNFFDHTSAFETNVDKKINHPVDIIYTEEALIFDLGWKISPKFDLAKITAKMENGLLRLEVPVSPDSKPKTIAIK